MYKSVEELQKLYINDDNNEVINEYLDYLFSKLNLEGQHLCRTDDFNNDLKQVISCSNKSLLYEMEDTFIINQLDRLINRREYLNDFMIETGMLTLIVTPLGIAYDIDYLYKKIKDKKANVIILDNLYDYVKRELLSSATRISSQKIGDYNLSLEEFELVKNTAQMLRKNLRFDTYSYVYNIGEYESCYGFDKSDLIIAYRLRASMKDKKKIIAEFKKMAKELNKPVILVYHPNHNAIHNLKLSSIANLELDNIDYIYGMLPGIDGYIKLK